jgi:hypothetical protein
MHGATIKIISENVFIQTLSDTEFLIFSQKFVHGSIKECGVLIKIS